MMFDQILPILKDIFREFDAQLFDYKPILINRDINGRIRLILNQINYNVQSKQIFDTLADVILKKIDEKHTYSFGSMFILEDDVNKSYQADRKFLLDYDIDNVYVIDRLATEMNWSHITAINEKTPRIVFYSIKGGVGRSSALAATAWSLAEAGKRVMVLDLDLESPGLSSSLLPEDRRPKYGICDWLVEDLVDNSDEVYNDMVAISPLSHNGDIYVVPAHGGEAGEYIAKLGRVWMPKRNQDGTTLSWVERLSKLLKLLEESWKPEIILIDSRAGIDDISSACITGLGATSILLFAVNGSQTWSGYHILFEHWKTTGRVQFIRERLQMVGAMLPDTGAEEYFSDLRQDSWNLYSEELYDEIPPSDKIGIINYWNFDERDESAPHLPLPIRWNRSFYGLKSLHNRLDGIDKNDVNLVFGPLIKFIFDELDIIGV